MNAIFDKMTELRNLIDKRFIHRPWGYLLDYAPPDGNAVIPTPDECVNGIPNVLGWSVSNENGAFFTGLYLYALCEAYEFEPSDRLKSEIHGLCGGLFTLCDVGIHDGFIARGVSTDGKSHYPFSSDDQAAPFILGLSKLLRSDAADENLKNEIKRRLMRTLNGIRNANWQVPTEWEGVMRGEFYHGDWRGAANLLYIAKTCEQIGIIDSDEFNRLRNERPGAGAYTRYEIVSHGFAPDMIRDTTLIQFWIDMCAQLCTFEMASLDREYAQYYLDGLKSNGHSVYQFFDDYKKYDNNGTIAYHYDWRVLNKYAKEWNDPAEAVSEAGRQCGIYNKEHFLRMYTEHRLLGNMLFGVWIALSSPDIPTRAYAEKKLSEVLEHTNWDTVSRSYAFAAVGAFYKSKIYER